MLSTCKCQYPAITYSPSNQLGYHMTIAFLAGEISNPFNILRKRYELRMEEEKAQTMGKWFCATFLSARLLLLPYFVKATQYSSEPLLFKLFCGAMFFISLIWSMMILNHLSKGLADVSA